MTEPDGDLSKRAPKSLRQPLAAAALSTLLFAAMMAWQITQRSALTMDELHTLLVAKLLVSGEEVPFFLGSVSRYEGGSWLIAWPVSWLLRLGAYGSAATCWAAGLISLSTVALSSWWLARNVRITAAVILGPLLALCTPEFLHYSYRAWGSLGEALIVFPLAAIAYGSWLRRGRPIAGAVLLGVLLSAAVVLSYLHMITALLFIVLQYMERSLLRPGRVVRDTLITGAVAVLCFSLWLWAAVPHLDEALTVRGGTPILATVPELLLVRLDRIALSLPQAWMGQHLDRGAWSLVMACGLSLLSLWSLVLVWRRGERGRWLVVLWLVLLPALSVGHSLAEHPDVLRYYVPTLVCSLAVIAAAGLRESLLALALGLLMWVPQGLPIPFQNPAHSYLELGGNALYRYAEDPHRKFRLLRERVDTHYQPWFAFGYGVDAGTRYGREMRTMAGALVDWSASGRSPDDNPHFVFSQPERWLVWSEQAEPPDASYFFGGIGVGLLADGRLDEVEAGLLGVLNPSQRNQVMEGLGAALVVGMLQGRALAEDWSAPLGVAGGSEDWLSVGRGIGAAGGGQRPDAADLGLVPGGDYAQAMSLGKAQASWSELRPMVQVSVRPTPAPLLR